ncbi:MAG TPA: hypothetical protein VEJ20_10445, partial [Candidatus Eremiobacteraceae bacterium]|nr:hypothetical protein [Candidatus Eremiobacteraceae bacterium]
MDNEPGGAEHVDVYDQWWRTRKPTRAWALRYDPDDRYDRVKDFVAARAAKLAQERKEKADRERLEREAEADRARAVRLRRITAVMSVFAIVLIVATAVVVTTLIRAQALSKRLIAAESAQVQSEAQANAIGRQLAKLQQSQIVAMKRSNTALTRQTEIATTAARAAEQARSEVQTLSNGDELGRVAQAMYAYGNERIAGLLSTDAYALDPSGVESKESLLAAAILSGAVGAVALPPWDLGASADNGRDLAVLAGERQSDYGQPVTGSLVAIDAASLSVVSHAAGVRASYLCGFDSVPRVAVAAGDTVELYDLSAAGGPAEIASRRTGALQGLACSPDGQLIVYVGPGGVMDEADFGSDAPQTLARIPGQTNGLAISPDGHYVAATTNAGWIYIYDLRAGKTAKSGRVLHDERTDCLTAAGCAGAIGFNPSGSRFAWYDEGRIYEADLSGTGSTSARCEPMLCDHPTLVYVAGETLPRIVGSTQSCYCVLSYDDDKKQYEKVYDDVSGFARHAIWDRELQLYATPYDPERESEPNPYGGGLAMSSLLNESGPLVGRFEQSQWIGSYAKRGHEMLIPGDNGFITYDLDR